VFPGCRPLLSDCAKAPDVNAVAAEHWPRRNHWPPCGILPGVEGFWSREGPKQLADHLMLMDDFVDDYGWSLADIFMILMNIHDIFTAFMDYLKKGRSWCCRCTFGRGPFPKTLTVELVSPRGVGSKGLHSFSLQSLSKRQNWRQ